MAIYHMSAKVIGRSQGRSSVASAAYRTGDEMRNERDGVTHDYTKKTGVVYSEILTPANSPEWAKDREKLWNEVERIEKRKDAQTAREVEVALPKELSRENQIKLVQDYAKDNFVDKGMIADFSIHDKGDGNPHAHIMLTTRTIDQNGFGGKEREWNKTEHLEKWREDWATKANKAMESQGIQDRIDHRSFEKQGIDKLPTVHEGPTVRAMEKKGIRTEIGEKNKLRKKLNEYMSKIDNKIKQFKQERSVVKEQKHEKFKTPTKSAWSWKDLIRRPNKGAMEKNLAYQKPGDKDKVMRMGR